MITAFLWPNLRKHFVNEFNEQYQTQTKSGDGSVRLFTVDELALYDGVEHDELYLSILGSVYDVSKGVKHYGPDGAYNFFIGELKTKLKSNLRNFTLIIDL